MRLFMDDDLKDENGETYTTFPHATIRQMPIGNFAICLQFSRTRATMFFKADYDDAVKFRDLLLTNPKYFSVVASG